MRKMSNCTRQRRIKNNIVRSTYYNKYIAIVHMHIFPIKIYWRLVKVARSLTIIYMSFVCFICGFFISTHINDNRKIPHKYNSFLISLLFCIKFYFPINILQFYSPQNTKTKTTEKPLKTYKCINYTTFIYINIYGFALTQAGIRTSIGEDYCNITVVHNT